jgi:hypothetical protein
MIISVAGAVDNIDWDEGAGDNRNVDSAEGVVVDKTLIGIIEGALAGIEDPIVLPPKSRGVAQFGAAGCEHCLYGPLLHTAPGSQQTESSLHASA